MATVRTGKSERVNITRADLDGALDRQTEAIEKLFDAKLEAVKQNLENAHQAIHRHAAEDDRHFSAIYPRLQKAELGLALTRLKVGLIISGIVLLSSTVSAIVTKKFLSIAIVEVPVAEQVHKP